MIVSLVVPRCFSVGCLGHGDPWSRTVTAHSGRPSDRHQADPEDLAIRQQLSAAKDLLRTLLERPRVEQLAVAPWGFNPPRQISRPDFPIWEEAEPPKGTVHRYPIRPWHTWKPRLPGFPAPPEIAVGNRAIIPRIAMRTRSSRQCAGNQRRCVAARP
jgi:hypothetical protein